MLKAHNLVNKVNLVVPGPEQPLVDGIETRFRQGTRLNCLPACKFQLITRTVGIPVFGPSAIAARMEGSKVFAKEFMARNKIPTATFRTFNANEVEQAIDYVKTCGHDVVLKASGLAAGKGVLIPSSVEEAMEGLREIAVNKAFGAAGTSWHSGFDIHEVTLLLRR
jgi:phosphoribosylamine--glycine ligase / phosphoribosylformylglycinamidine cyclo-ligase